MAFRKIELAIYDINCYTLDIMHIFLYYFIFLHPQISHGRTKFPRSNRKVRQITDENCKFKSESERVKETRVTG